MRDDDVSNERRLTPKKLMLAHSTKRSVMNPASLAVVISVQKPMINVAEMISVGSDTTPEYFSTRSRGEEVSD